MGKNNWVAEQGALAETAHATAVLYFALALWSGLHALFLVALGMLAYGLACLRWPSRARLVLLGQWALPCVLLSLAFCLLKP